MQVAIRTLANTEKGKQQLPSQFDEAVRPDLVHKAVLAIQSHKRQPYGADPDAGNKYSSKTSKRRRKYRGSYGSGGSRTPKKILSRRGTRIYYVGATAPNTVGGRRAHPPKAEKLWEQKINVTERRKAIRSAMAAVMQPELVKERGHIIPESYPFVVEDALENIKTTKELRNVLEKLGFEEELSRASERGIRAGKGKMRGRKYVTKKSILFVVSNQCELMKAASNILGCEVVTVDSLNAELLAPGTHLGRVTLFSAKAIERLDKEKLFTRKKTSEKEGKKDTQNTAQKTDKPSEKEAGKSKPKAKKKAAKKTTKKSVKKTKKATKASKK